MKTELVQIVFLAIVTVFAAVAQDLCPAIAGTKPPFLALAALFGALRPEPRLSRRDRTDFRTANARLGLFAALLAGFFLDALDGLPFGCATIFLVIVCTLARLLRPALRELTPAVTGLLAAVAVVALFELWLRLWMPGACGEPLVMRTLAALPMAALAGAATFLALPAIRRMIGLDLAREDFPGGRAA